MRLDAAERKRWDEPMHKFVLRLPLRLAKMYFEWSRQRGISINTLIVEALEDHLRSRD